MGTILVRNIHKQSSFSKVVERTIGGAFSLTLNTKAKKTAAATVFIAFYALVPFALYFGVGGYIAGFSVLSFEFVTSEMGLGLVVGSSLASIALLVVNIALVSKPIPQQRISQNLPIQNQRIPVRVISHAIPVETKSEIGQMEKSVTLQDLETHCQRNEWDHNFLVNYMLVGKTPATKQDRLSEILTKALLKEKLPTFNKFIKYLENINDPCIWIDEKTKENLLCYFTRKKDLPKIRVLLEKFKADAGVSYKVGISLLSYACSKAEESNLKKIDLTIVDFLLKFRADPNGPSHQSEGETLLEYFSKDPKRLPLAKLFVEHEVNLTLRACINAVQSAPNILEYFIKTYDLVEIYGVQIFKEAQNSNNRIASLNYLFEAGFSLERIEEDVLLPEIKIGNFKWVKFFVEKGARINSNHLTASRQLTTKQKSVGNNIHFYLQTQFRRQKSIARLTPKELKSSEQKHRFKKNNRSQNGISHKHLPKQSNAFL